MWVWLWLWLWVWVCAADEKELGQRSGPKKKARPRGHVTGAPGLLSPPPPFFSALALRLLQYTAPTFICRLSTASHSSSW